MKISIQYKFLLSCIFLVLLTVISMSGVYYLITRERTRRETRKQIQIAFDIIFDDYGNRANLYKDRFEEFVRTDGVLNSTALLYARDSSQISSKMFIVGNLGMLAEGLRDFGDILAADEVALYGSDKRLLAIYQSRGQEDIMGVYAMASDETPTFLLTNDTVTNRSLGSLLLDDSPLPTHPLPESIVPVYTGDIPDTPTVVPFSREQRIGIRVLAPIYHQEQKTGILIGDMFYTPEMVTRYAALSQNAINFFAGNLLSTGTLPEQASLDATLMQQFTTCEDLRNNAAETVTIVPYKPDLTAYYQGGCVLTNASEPVGAITVSLSQDIEKQELRKIVIAVVLVSVCALGAALGLSLIFAQKTVHSIHQLVSIIGSAAEGDLRKTAVAITRDEIGMLAVKFNQMILQLRTISGQVQNASKAVHATADTILQQMRHLIEHMEEQSTSVDTTTDSVERVDHFIDTVASDTSDLLSAAEQILASLRETQASIHEVTSSISHLTDNLQQILSSIDQQNQSVKHIAEHTDHLTNEAQHTETAIFRIEQSLRGVSENADQSQNLAKETMDAALRAQAAVDASIHGMNDLKEAVAQTADIIQEMNVWGGRINSILDIVNEITEQTSLLALNASIISAQAGTHGRGFAVVADEIKELAIRTKTSTKEIDTLIHELQAKTADGVRKTSTGIAKADQGVQLSNAVQEALNTILDSATRSSSGASNTAQVVQQTVTDSQLISASINRVTDMVSQIRAAIYKQEQDIEQVVTATEMISGMAEQVNRASVEQRRTTDQMAENMEQVAHRFSVISQQTSELKHNVAQIVRAMHLTESTTTETLRNATNISTETVTNLLHESEILQKIVNIFQVS